MNKIKLKDIEPLGTGINLKDSLDGKTEAINGLLIWIFVLSIWLIGLTLFILNKFV